ncbi:hypothetical protein [Viscerimonas tarda]
MKKIYMFFIALFFVAMGVAGCGDDEKIEAPGHYDTPQEAILGKWRLIAQGPSEDKIQQVSSGGYVEYLPDSIIQPGTFAEHPGLQVKYSIDSCLFKTYYYHVGQLFDEKTQMHGYEYKFEDNYNKLILKHVKGITSLSLGTPLIFFYKRIK